MAFDPTNKKHVKSLFLPGVYFIQKALGRDLRDDECDHIMNYVVSAFFSSGHQAAVDEIERWRHANRHFVELALMSKLPLPA